MSTLCRFRARDNSSEGGSGKIIKRFRKMRRGEYVYRAGEPLNSICAVCSGSVKTCTVGADGSLRVTGLQIPGELVGLQGLAGKRHVCDAVALESTVVCEILFQQLQDLCEVEPTLARQLLRMMADQLAGTRSLLAPFVGRKHASERLAAYLICLSQRFSERGFSGMEFNLAMSRSDIGNYLGLAKETVSRLCGRFEEMRVVAFEGSRLHILDRSRLGALARGEQLT